MLYPVAYCTLQAANAANNNAGTDDTALRTQLIYDASAMFSTSAGRVFEPFRGTRNEDITNAAILFLDDDLLVLDEITERGEALLSTAYTLLDSNTYPKYAIERVDSYWHWRTTPKGAIGVAGVWGFHDNPAVMFRSQTTTTGVNATATTLPVASVSGIGVLSLIRVGDEYMRVTAVTSTPSAALTVERGINGTTAAIHAAATVYLFRVVDDVQRAVVTFVNYLYNTRDQYGERVAALEGSYEISKLMPEYVYHTALRRMRNRYGATDDY